VLGPSGDRVNKYMYDPFGRMLERDEQFPQDFTFVGQWGVTAEREFKDVYWMRSRYYDAQLGRFFSLDPLGKNSEVDENKQILFGRVKKSYKDIFRKY